MGQEPLLGMLPGGGFKRAFEEMGVGRQGYCGIGSVKSNIGHLRYAAGGGVNKGSFSIIQ